MHFAPFPSNESELATTYAAMDRAFETGTIGAVLVEPVLGEVGASSRPPRSCVTCECVLRAAGALLIVDEIWTGLGRSGRTFATPDEVVPDVICLAKGLGGGLPISACVGSANAMAAWGAHGGGARFTLQRTFRFAFAPRLRFGPRHTRCRSRPKSR